MTAQGLCSGQARFYERIYIFIYFALQHSILPGKVWIWLTTIGMTTVVTYVFLLYLLLIMLIDNAKLLWA